ncbi:MAG: hypothetical protein AB7O44_00665 [Hyphomicrobiaceae bacterium]
MVTNTDVGRETQARDGISGALRWGALGAVGVVFAGALYLIAVRGEALLLDLSALGRIFCL